MDNEAVEMSYEADVLDRVMDEHDIPRKRLAAKMSIHKATISKWLSSTATIPVTAFRNLFDLTHDPRLIRLITGETPGFFQITLDGSENRMQIPPLDQLVPQACEATEQTAAALKYIARIVQDGKVDDADRQAIEQFRKHAAHAQRLLCLTTAALTVYEKRGATR